MPLENTPVSGDRVVMAQRSWNSPRDYAGFAWILLLLVHPQSRFVIHRHAGRFRPPRRTRLALGGQPMNGGI